LIASIQPLKNFWETALVRAPFSFASLLFAREMAKPRQSTGIHISGQRISKVLDFPLTND
jgi:hypothetical protein